MNVFEMNRGHSRRSTIWWGSLLLLLTQKF